MDFSGTKLGNKIFNYHKNYDEHMEYMPNSNYTTVDNFVKSNINSHYQMLPKIQLLFLNL